MNGDLEHSTPLENNNRGKINLNEFHSKVPPPPPPPPPPLPLKGGTLNGSGTRVLGAWPPPELKMCKKQAQARNLVLNEIKELQLKRQSSFKRIQRLPMWNSISGKIL